MTNKIQQHLEETEKLFDEKFEDTLRLEVYVNSGNGTRHRDTVPVGDEVKDFINQSQKELIELIRGEVIEMLENTDVQMSANGDVSENEKAMAKFLYKAHCNHIIKKLQTYGK